MRRFLLVFLLAAGAVDFSKGYHCCTPQCSSSDIGKVRLVGGSNAYEGRVEFCYSNRYAQFVSGAGFWGRVCGGGTTFGNEEAMVVCRQLGYASSGAVSATTSFGVGSSSYYITVPSVHCSGSESSITACSIYGLGGSWYSCSSQTSDAGVHCQFSGCTHGAVRLVGGSVSAGRVEICVNNVWGTVCHDSWSVVDANVACRQLGYSNADAIARTNAYYGQGSGPILLDDVACSGTESQLISCSYDSNTLDCGHDEDAGVECQPRCSHGTIRLSGGSSLQGRVEVCLNGLWGTVCDDFWGTTDANVACRQLGYSNADAVPYYNAHFGQGIVPILLDDVNCVGSESQLISCSYDSSTGDCSHSDDAGVQCQARCTHGQLRLVGGSSVIEGRVEVCISGLWGTVCDDFWGITDANVVCRQLGFSNSDATAYGGAAFGQGIIPILLDDVACSGSESQLVSCSYNNITSDCSHSEDAGVRCQSQCTHGSIRVIGGSYNYEGRVEICVNGLWGTVCDDSWSVSDAQVACKQLGYPISNPTAFSGAYFGQGTLPILLDDVACTGMESRLVDCYYDTYTGDCSHSQDAGVKCRYIPSPVVIGTPQSNSVSSEDLVYYQLPFPTNGVTIQLNVGSGTIVCYASDTITNPSEDSGYDWRIETSGYADVFIDPALLGRPPGSSIYVGLQGVLVSNTFTIDSTMGDTRVPDVVGVDFTVSITLNNGQRQYFQFPFPSEGITIRLDIGSGYITCYASDRLQNPNGDQGYDWRVSAMSYIDLFLDPTTLGRPAGDALYLSLEGMSSVTANTFSINATTGDRRLPNQTAIDMAVSNSVGNGQLQYYQYPFPSNGLTVTLSVGTGRVYCYVSVTIQNPNEAQGYDWKVEVTGYTDVFIDPFLVGGASGYVYVGIEGLVGSGSNFTLNTTSGDRKVPSAFDVGSLISDSIETGVRKYFQYAFNSSGVTVAVNVGQGSVVCYASDRYRNPNEFQGYDWKISISSYADVYLDPKLLGRTAGEYIYVAIEGAQITNSFTLGTLSGDRRAPTTVTSDVAVTGALQAARRQYFEFPFPVVGITIALNVGLGTVLCYASDVIQNPNEIQNYDWKIETSGYADVFIDPGVLERPAKSSLYVGLEGVQLNNNFTINTTSGDRRLPTQMPLDGNVTDTVINGVIHYFQFPFPTFGITVQLYVSGYVICYSSDRIQNPNANQGYDWKIEGGGYIDSFLDVTLLERAGGAADIVFIAIEGGHNVSNYSLSTTSGDRRAPFGIEIGYPVYKTVLRNGERQYFQLPFLSSGITVALSLTVGSITCYGSDIIQNPNEVQGYVWKVTTSLYADVFLDPTLLLRDVGEYVYIGIEGAEVQNNTFTLNTSSGDRRVPTAVALDTAVVGTVGKGERLYFQFIFPEDGLTLRLTVVQGYTVCYASDREQNPNKNQGYDWKIETDDYIDTFIDPQLQIRPQGDYVYVAIEGTATNNTFNLNTTSDDRRVPELVEIGMTLSTSLVNKEVVYYELPFPNSGVTIRLSTSLGAVICYASDVIQNTNRKHGYDWRIETNSYTDAFIDPATLGRLAGDSLFIAVEGVGNKSNFTINSFTGDFSTKVPVQPYDIEAVHLSPVTANITWQAPPPNVHTPLGIILYYNLTISEEQFALSDVTVVTKNTWFVFTGLEEFNTYTCTVVATNGVGSGLLSAPFNISTLQAAPSASPQTSSGIAQSPTIITLTWSPPPHIHANGIIQKYIIDITEVRTGRIFTLQTINLNIVVGSLHPYYIYECRIAAYTVSTGVFSEPFNVTTQESAPTVSPTNITVAEISSTSVTLSWNELPFEDRNGLIREYHVRVIHSRTGLTYEITASTTTALVDGLLPFHVYKFAVSAETISVGPFSEDISIQLLQDVPHAAPQNITGSVINSTSIFLAWEPPPLDGHNGEITGYHINIVETATNTTLLVITNDTEAILSSLHPAYQYEITISAVTIGPGVPSLNITLQTAEAAPSEPPQNVSGIPVSSEAVSLSWIVPAPESQNGIIIGYVINIFARETRLFYSETTFLTVDVLKPYTTYNCTIAARTAAGVGPFSNAVILRTLEDVPAEPQNISVQKISNFPNYLLISWNPPLQPNGIITSYTVYCYASLVDYISEDSMTLHAERQSKRRMYATTTTGLDSDVIVEGLQPFTYYDCFVTTNTSVGEGNESMLHSARTDESAPADPPTNLTSSIVNSTAIHILWSDPLIPYGIVIAYTVTYNISDVPVSVTQNVELGREYVASGLDEYTVYKFEVSASTRVGPSPSGIVIARTGEAKPSGPPTNIKSSVTGSRKVNISWFPPNLRDQNGRILFYTMVVSDKGFGAPDISINATAMQYTLMNLEEYNSYSCKIAAGTTIGLGPYSDPFEFTTLQDSPSSPPVNLFGSPQSPSIIMLSWSPPPDIDLNGIIQYYIVKVREVETGRFWTFHPMEKKFTLGSLHPYYNYECQAAGYTIAVGPFSDTVFVQTEETVPSASPAALTVVNTASDSFTLTWEPPPSEEINGFIRYYVISVTETNTGRVHNVTPNTTQATLDGLHPFYTYSYTVTAVTVGLGPHTIPMLVQLAEAAPVTPPLDVSATAINATTVFLSWSPPALEDQNGIIRQYIINQTEENTNTVVTETTMNTDIAFLSLHPDYLYTFRVVAVTVEASPASTPVSVQTPQDAPSAPPENFAVSSTTANTISLTWDPPSLENQNGVIIEYLILVTTESDLEQTYQLSSITSNITVDSLIPFSMYTCSVAAVTIAGSGPYSHIITVMTNESAPTSSPEDFTADFITSTALFLSWLPPPEEKQNGLIREYRINVTEIKTAKTLFITRTSTSVIVSSLHPFYKYECVVSSFTIDVGPYTDILIVKTLEDVPSGYPININAELVASRSARLTWDPPQEEDQNGNIIIYLVNITVLEAEETFQLATNSTSITVNALKPFTTYLCIIAAGTHIGIGPFSTAFTLQTLEDAPTAPPQSLFGIATSTTTAYLAWTPPLLIEQNGIIRGYTVIIEELETGIRFFRESIATSVEVDSLHPNYAYHWKVAAVTVETGPYSSQSNFTMPQDVPIGAPQNLIGKVLNSESIALSWEPPPLEQQNGVITGYAINISSIDLEEHQQLFTSFVNITVRGLAPYTTYVCLVAASTIIGHGPVSVEISLVTSEEAPSGAPVNISGIAINSTHIHLQWEPPPEDQHLGDITGYKINITELETGFMYQKQTEVTKIVIESLHPYYSYSFAITASTSAGDGPYSASSTLRTHEDGPSSSPLSLEGRALTSTSILLSWEPPPPQDQNGIIRQYVIILEVEETGETSTAFSTLTSANVTTLKPFTTYLCTVAAQTSEIGPMSDAVMIQTLEAAPIAPPDAVIAQSLGSTTLQLTWQPPSQEGTNGIIRQYTVILTEILTGKVLQFNTNGTAITVESLHPFYTYSCVAAAETTALGPFSSPVAVEMPEDAPSSPPTSLSVSKVTSTSFLLSWSSPPTEDHNGLIRHYIINITEENTGRVFQETSQTTEKEIEFLHPHYHYTCTVAAVTVATGPFTISITTLVSEDRPTGAPVNVEAVPLSQTSVLLSWEPPVHKERNGVITGYTINITAVDAESAVQLLLSGNVTDAAVENLLPFHTYLCVVAAETSQGIGPFSPAVSVRTLEAPTTAPPEAVSHTLVTPTSILLTWNPPPADHHNGVIQFYTVAVIEVETGRHYMINVTATELLLTNLHPFYNYHLAVAAVTVATGPYTALYSIQTPESVPSAPPQNFVAGAIDSRTLGLEWNPPPPQYHNGIIREYLINVTVSDNGEQFQLTSNTTQLRVNNLHPYYTYTCLITAVTIGAGPFSEMYTIQMPEDAPTAPPQSFAGEVLSSTTISVTWLPPVPEQQNGFIRLYAVSVHELPTNQTFSFQRAGHHTMLVVPTLHPHYEYQLSVAAETIALGPFTTPIILQTNEDVPSSPPRALQGSAIDSKTIQLSWQPPFLEDQNGVIRNYIINVGEEETDETYQLSSDTQSITASGLHPYYTYTFTIAAVTTGPGPFSSGQTITTPEDVPSGPPHNVNGMAVSSSSIRLTWNLPVFEEQNGIINSFYITIIELETGSIMEFQKDGVDMILIVNFLHPYYVYRCGIAASTVVGIGPSADVDIQTLPEAPTGAPQNLTIAQLNARFVEVVWEPPSLENRNGPIVAYTLSVMGIDTDELLDFHTNATKISITNLHPFYSYSITVSALGNGLGPANTITVQLLETFPGEPVQSLMVEVLSPTSVIMSWLPPSIQSWNGIITQYVITYKLLGPVGEEPMLPPYTLQTVNKTSNSLENNPDPRIAAQSTLLQRESVTLSNLEEYYTYRFTVYVQNSAGISEESNTITASLPSSVPSGSPVHVRIQILSSTSLLIVWQPPNTFDRNGIITGYEVNITHTRDQSTVVYDVIGTSLSLHLEGLQEFSEYSVIVAAKTALGKGPYSLPVVKRTYEDVPGAPKDLALEIISTTAVNITWRAPDDPNGVILNYQVTYNGYHLDEKKNEQLTDGPHTLTVQATMQIISLVLSNLSSGLTYEIKVRGGTMAGYGEYTSAETITLPIGQAVAVGSDGKNTITAVAVLAALTWLIIFIVIAAIFIWRKRRTSVKTKRSIQRRSAMDFTNQPSAARLRTHNKADIEDTPLSILNSNDYEVLGDHDYETIGEFGLANRLAFQEEQSDISDSDEATKDLELHLDDSEHDVETSGL